MTIDSTYAVEQRSPATDKTRYYFEFETATDSEVEVWLTDANGNRIQLVQVAGEGELV